ncbi:MAG: hypothetical protein ACMVY4_18660 [Minwuia sp.]|uniref:hypothetical protein n=1 Tax=Minwuia sp. TaxID=2493630 RepID=UPI003A83D61A
MPLQPALSAQIEEPLAQMLFQMQFKAASGAFRDVNEEVDGLLGHGASDLGPGAQAVNEV